MDTGDVAETRSVPKSPPGPCTALGAGVVVTASLRAGNKVMDTTDGVEDGFAIARNVRVEQHTAVGPPNRKFRRKTRNAVPGVCPGTVV